MKQLLSLSVLILLYYFIIITYPSVILVATIMLIITIDSYINNNYYPINGQIAQVQTQPLPSYIEKIDLNLPDFFKYKNNKVLSGDKFNNTKTIIRYFFDSETQSYIILEKLNFPNTVVVDIYDCQSMLYYSLKSLIDKDPIIDNFRVPFIKNKTTQYYDVLAGFSEGILESNCQIDCYTYDDVGSNVKVKKLIIQDGNIVWVISELRKEGDFILDLDIITVIMR